MTWVLVRHGQTEWNRRGMIQGQTDVPLNRRGKAQARAAGKLLRGEPLSLALVSDLARARETARLALGRRRVPTIVSSALRELDFGKWEGLRAADIRARVPRARLGWMAGLPGRRYPAGECFRDACARVRPVLAAAARRARGGTVLVVGHQGSLQAALVILLGFRLAAGRLFRIPGGGLTRVETPKI